ncbi:MAG: hypothetical protein HQ508_00715 [Candidatus Marinimicrobia bacterium]|nr:hypothetical protein [Candidatus Neomarinimicrobiota bacterium]
MFDKTEQNFHFHPSNDWPLGEMPNFLEEFIRQLIGQFAAKETIEGVFERLEEDDLYALVAEELHRGVWDEAAKLRAFSEAEGDENKAKALYSKIRVRRIKDLAVKKALDDYIEAQAAEQERLAKSEQEKRLSTTGINYQGYAIIKAKNHQFEIREAGVALKGAPRCGSIKKAKQYIDAIS